MDLHKLRILKFDDHASKIAASKKDLEGTNSYNDISSKPIKDPKPLEGKKKSKLMSVAERISRPRKRMTYCKKRKSTSDVSLSSQSKKLARKRTLSLSDVKKSFKNSMNSSIVNPTKHMFDLLSGDSELHITKKRRNRKKRKRQNKINKDMKILFICETPRISRKSRKRSKKYYKKDSFCNMRSSEDIFGFQKSNRTRTLSQYLYNANCNYFNTFRKFKMGFQRKKKCSDIEPRRKHTRVRLLSTDYLSSIESSLKHYSIVNTCITNGQKCVKLHSYTGRKTGSQSKRPTVDEKVSVAPSSLAKMRKCSCNISVGTTKSLIRQSCSNGTRYRYSGTQTQQKGRRRSSHESHCPFHRTAHSLHEKPQPPDGSACVCTQYPSGTKVDAPLREINKTNQSDEHTCGPRTCINKHYPRLYGKALEKLTTLYLKPQTIARNIVKYALLGLLIIIWCPCVFAIGLVWIISYPLKLQHVITVDKTKKQSTFSGLFSKFRKNHRDTEKGRIFNENCSYPKRKGFLSWLSTWSSRAANNIAKSINTLIAIFKINKTHPVSESSFCLPKHPRPGKKYSLFYEANRGWVMKPVPSQDASTPYHRNNLVQNVRHGCRFNDFRQRLARNKRHEQQQGSSLFRSSTNDIETMPTCWETKSVHSNTLPCNQVITLPKPPNLNIRPTGNKLHTAKSRQIEITDKSQILHSNIKASPGRNSQLVRNASYRLPKIKSKETSNRKSYGVQRNVRSLNKCTKSTQHISSQNFVMPRRYLARGIASTQCAVRSNPYRYPNRQSNLLPKTNKIQASASGLNILYRSNNFKPNFSSKVVSPNSSMSVDKPYSHLSKRVLSQPSKMSLNSLSSRQICLTKLLYTVGKLHKYLEQTRLTDRSSKKQKVKNADRLDYARKQQSSISPSTSQFVPRMSVITNFCKCSGDNLISPKESHFSCDPNKIPFIPKKYINLGPMKQDADSLAIKCTCVDNKTNHHLQNSIDEQNSTFPANKQERCSCLSQKQASADYKSTHLSSKTLPPKDFKCTCPEDGLKDSLESPSYLPEKQSQPSQSSKVTKSSKRNVSRYLRKTVDKLQHAMHPAEKLPRCLCLSHKQASADYKSSHLSSKTLSSKDFTCTCPEDGLIDSSKNPSYSSAEPSISSESSKITKRSTKSISRYLRKTVDKLQHSTLSAKKLKKCSCLSQKQASAGYKSSYLSSKTVSPKDFKCTCPEDGLKDSLKSPSYSPDKQSLPSQSSKVTKRSTKSISRYLRNTVDKLQHSTLPTKKLERCLCLPHKQASANDKSSHRLSKSITSKDLKCKCPEDSSKAFLKSPSNSDEELSLRSQSSKGTKRSIRSFSRYLRKTVDKLHAKKKYSGSSKICRCFADPIKSEDSLDKQGKQIKKNNVVCECPRDLLNPQNKQQDLSKKQMLREGAVCKCQIEKPNRIAEEPQLLAQYDINKKKQAKRNSGTCECPVEKLSYKLTRGNNQGLCKCQPELPQSLPLHDLTGKKRTDKNNVIWECPKNLSSTYRDPITKNQNKRNNAVCECPVHRHLNYSQHQSNKPASEKVKRSHPLCECRAEKPEVLPSYNKDNTPLHKQTIKSQTHDKQYKIASEKSKGDDPSCECPTDKLRFIPYHLRSTGNNDKTKQNSTLCECRDKNLKFPLNDERASTHPGPNKNSWDCECHSEETKLLPRQILTNKKQNKRLCQCTVDNTTLQPYKVPSENVKRNGLICECLTVRPQSPRKLTPKRSPTKSIRGSKIKCNCSGKHPTSQHYPYDRVLHHRSRKSDNFQSKSLATRKETKSSQKPHFECGCSHEKPNYNFYGKQSNNLVKSDKVDLKSSFEKLFNVSSHACTCSSKKVLSKRKSKRAAKQSSLDETLPLQQKLPKTSDNLGNNNTGDMISRFLLTHSKIHPKSSLHTLDHPTCMCTDEKPKCPSCTESKNSVKSRNWSSQRVRFEQLRAPQCLEIPRQPKPADLNKFTCTNDKTQPIPDCLSYHPLKLQTGKTDLFSSTSSSSKDKITSYLRNTIDKLHSTLARYISSDIDCKCPDEESDNSLYKDSQDPCLRDNNKHKLALNKDIKCSCKHDNLSSDEDSQDQRVHDKKKSKLALTKDVKCTCKHDKLPSDNKPLVDNHNNGLFQYPPRQQAISSGQQCKSADQVTAAKCFSSKEVQHRFVEASSHPIHRTHAASTQWIQSAYDPCQLPLRFQSPSCQPIFRSHHRLPPQTVKICTPTCISKRSRPSPPGPNLGYPTIIPDPLCRRYAVQKRKSNRDCIQERKKKPTRKRKSFGKTFCNCYSYVKRTIANADAEMWPKDFHCDGKMYIHTLRRKPCYCILKHCPSMYPCILTILSLTKSMWTMCLYVVAFISWCPFFCCICLFCEDLCCCLPGKR